jgi:hypothetical protein
MPITTWYAAKRLVIRNKMRSRGEIFTKVAGKGRDDDLAKSK